MGDRNFVNSMVALGAGLFASSISSFLEHFPVLGTATDFTRGLSMDSPLSPLASQSFSLFGINELRKSR